MLKVSPHDSLRRATSRKASRSSPNCGQKLPKYLSMSQSGNSSLPAGTGVCVVNRLVERTRSMACA